jgi:hypothetical protein
MVATTLMDRLVYHAQLITPKGKRYRLKDRGCEVKPTDQATSVRPSA